MSTIYQRIQARDLSGLVDVDNETGCWNWKRGRNAKQYGLVTVERDDADAANTAPKTTRRAHRLVWEAFAGIQIPRGLHGMHLCSNPSCVNPAHIVLGTNDANQADRWMGVAGTGRHAQAGVAA